MEKKFDNSFVNLREEANGRVSVKLQPNALSKSDSEQYYGKVTRVTYSNQNILDMVAEELPDMTIGKITDVMTAYTTVLRKTLANGCACKFGTLGTFYIASKGTTESANGKTELTIKFTPEKTMRDSVVQKIEITESTYVAPKITVDSMTDIARNAADGVLKSGTSVSIRGNNLRIGGTESGIWCAPVNDEGKLTGDASNWKEVTQDFFLNTSKNLIFALPEDLEAGTKYCFVLKTRCIGYSKRERRLVLQATTPSFEVVA